MTAADLRQALREAEGHVAYWRQTADRLGEELVHVKRQLHVLERAPRLRLASTDELLEELRARIPEVARAG